LAVEKRIGDHDLRKERVASHIRDRRKALVFLDREKHEPPQKKTQPEPVEVANRSKGGCKPHI